LIALNENKKKLLKERLLKEIAQELYPVDLIKVGNRVVKK